jgi:hypothetical protein
MFEKVGNDKWSGRKVYHWLKFDLNFKTATGNKNLTLSNVYMLLQNPFYYGVFEYPRKSGNWYTGKHEAIIDKELFERVHTQLKRSDIVRHNKEFAFTKIMVCGLCGSGVTADEKYKKLANGSTATYVYYCCSKSKDRNCKGSYLREEDLIEQLVSLIDKISVDELGVRSKFLEEIKRYAKFRAMVIGKEKEVAEIDEIDIKVYMKYLLKAGTIQEKRELLSNLKSWLKLRDKQIVLEEK